MSQAPTNSFERQSRVFVTIQTRVSATQSDLVCALGWSAHHVDKALQSLRKAGRIYYKNKHWHIRPTIDHSAVS